MDITIRLETEQDWREVELLTREAFWKKERIEEMGIGCDEHYLAHTLRTAPEFIPELDFVAEFNGRLVGNIMYSKSYVLLPDGSHHEVINFGPLSVLPEFQKQGVGSALMRHSLKVATELGYGAVIFFGHPTYYPRFGFKEAKEFNISTSKGENFPAFMAMELIEGDLKGISGNYYELPLFDVDIDKARVYDVLFQKK
ncbi:GNAT family N-acetyltransferase [Vallitalea okinawensis]|uniref:GNAT family N-acetyltransferase n=1 Tax=Vallitalea okinawensis TaxID=2078660 RepID=UPI000CFCA846|nr:N-acetyltransferase [Vallitalea okinawensis]